MGDIDGNNTSVPLNGLSDSKPLAGVVICGTSLPDDKRVYLPPNTRLFPDLLLTLLHYRLN